MTISVWIQQRRSLIFLFILLAAIFPILLQIVQPFITPFIIAIIIAVTVNPAQEWLSRKLRRRGVATILTTLATVIVLGSFVTLVGITITKEATTAYKEFSDNSLEAGGWPSLVTATTNKVVNKISSRLPIDKEAIRGELMKSLKTVSGFLFSHIGMAVSQITNLLFNGLLITVFLYFLLKHGKDWIIKLTALTPLDKIAADNILKSIHGSVVANVNGMFAVVIGQGALLTLGFWFAGVRSPVLWGALGGFASIVPLVGGLLVWAPVAIGLLLMGAYWKSLILCLWCILIVGSADNVLRSIVVGKHENQHAVLVALAVIGGTYAFGVLGILIGPLAISLATALWKEIHQLNTSAGDEEYPIKEAEQRSLFL
jgi:predicted PurR-regulated permease PerM